MKRRIAIIIVFLILGAIVNLAVAWGFAIGCGPSNLQTELTSFGRTDADAVVRWSRTGSDRWFLRLAPISEAQHLTALMERHDRDQLHQILMQDADGVGLWIATNFVGERIAGDADQLLSRSQIEPRSDFAFHSVDLRGWPARSMSCDFSPLPQTASTVFDLRGGLLLAPHTPTGPFATLGNPWLEIRVLPLRPIWPGFAINTLFYAAILWLLFATPFAARRMIRRRRGLCEKCAYPIGTWGGSPVCTECGAAVSQRQET